MEMQDKIKWGIIGPGRIAHKFVADLQLSKQAVLQGVASRSMDRARSFGQQYGFEKYYGSYEELAMDPAIDVVYIATPHPFHFENTMLCLDNNKSVLCEKPMGMDAGQVKAMIEKARSKELFLMEGIWTRFIPATAKLIDLIHENQHAGK